VRVEPLRVEDADDMVEVLSDARLYEFTGGSPPDLEELRRRFRVQVTEVSPDGRETWLNWVVRLRSDGTAIGYVQASLERASADVEVAWVIGRTWQGLGYASEAVGAMVTALRAAGTRRLVARVRGDHAASRRVAERAGLAPTGTVVDDEDEWEWRAP
jgi:RimJ/RimL family protein N-acetyltransferase